MDPEPLIIEGPEQAQVNTDLPDAGLPPAVGVQSWCVFRASRDVPEMTDRYGWTYHHHVDMACWKGRLYVGWNTCEKDEDVWPSRELYSTSADGVTWTEPAEMFPQGISTPLRMYFFLARNGRMLMIAGMRSDTEDTSEDRKGGLVAREIFPDHTLGRIYSLQLPRTPPANPPGMFDESGDAGFIDACRQLLSDRIYLEQQDLGRLLGPRRMKWHDASSWPGGKVPGDNEKWVCGKAFSFFRRPDQTIVGVCKMGYVTTSTDNGETWQQPVVPPTLVTGKAKVWTQRTRDGRYALVYNPSTRTRYPLIVVASDDGVQFRRMRIVQGELPVQRYEGRFRSIGPQYTRGIGYADDGSRADEQAMWLVYSMSKEDIWVSRVPLPIKADATTFNEPWNTYCPKWASVRTDSNGAELTNRDPYDYARAMRVFPDSARVNVAFDVSAAQHDRGTLQIELLSKFGSARPVRVTLDGDGRVRVGDEPVATYSADRPLRVEISADAAASRYSVSIDGKRVADDIAFAEPADMLHRVSFRTGAYRGIGGTERVPRGADVPQQSATYRIANLHISVP